jgi:hypothetical protein
MAEERIVITDELLAAFLDGNVNGKEVQAILQAAAEDSSLQEFLSIAADVSEIEIPKDHEVFPIPHRQGRI